METSNLKAVQYVTLLLKVRRLGHKSKHEHILEKGQGDANEDNIISMFGDFSYPSSLSVSKPFGFFFVNINILIQLVLDSCWGYKASNFSTNVLKLNWKSSSG